MNTLLFMMKFSLPFPFKKVKGIFTNNLQGKLRDLFISILCIEDSPLISCKPQLLCQSKANKTKEIHKLRKCVKKTQIM